MWQSICYNNCVQFDYVNISVTVVVMLLIIISPVEGWFLKQTMGVLAGFVIIFWYCFCLLFDLAFALSITSMLIFVHNHTGPNRSLKQIFYIVLCVILTGTLAFTLRRDTIVIHFLLIGIAINDILKLLSPRVSGSIFQIFIIIVIVVIIIDAYVFDGTSVLFVFLDTYWGYASVIMLGFLLFLCFFCFLFVTNTFTTWLQSSTVDCSALCEETFPLDGFATRFHAIDKQLAMTNRSARGYYSGLKFPYYNPFNISVCFSYCTMSIRTSLPEIQRGKYFPLMVSLKTLSVLLL